MVEETPRVSHVRMQRLFAFLLKYWWVPVLTLTLGLSAGIAYLRWMPPSFVSIARMWEPERVRLPEGTLFSEDMQNFIGTQSELLQSSKLRGLALARLSASGSNVVALGENGQPLPVKVQVTPSAKSSIFVLSATSSDSAYSRRYLDALMAVYLEYKRDLRKELSGDTLASISEKVQLWEGDLKTQQDILTAFEKTNNLAILQEEGTIAGGYLARLKTQLSDLQLEERLLNDTDRGTNNAGLKGMDAQANENSATSTGVRSEEQTAFRDIAVLKIQREKLSKYLRPKHPKIVKLDADIERAEKLMDVFRHQNREELDALRQTIQLKINDTQALIKETESKVVEATGSIAEAERLKLNVQRVQSVYDRLVTLVQNVGISRDIEPETLSILEPASYAMRSYNQEKNALAVGILGGICLGLGIIYLVAVRDDRFASVIELNEKYGNAVVGLVPELSGVRQDGLLPLLRMDDERHIYVEAYRSLRSALFFGATEGERPRVLLITSAVPNEGKSTISANLARTMALGGSRVVLVDADMRRGSLHQLMDMQRTPGLAELLWQTDDLEKVIQKDSLPNLSFISRGVSLSNPGDFLLGPRLDQVLKQLRQRFDYVLIDSSPVFAADDATTLAPKVDGTLLVVRRGFSSARAVQEALDLLSQRQAKVLGLIFNRANASARTYYYYKYADYHRPANAS
jgi:polysaccharide biosynthesis transport protein